MQTRLTADESDFTGKIALVTGANLMVNGGIPCRTRLLHR
jgi:hypothetical protein